VHLLN